MTLFSQAVDDPDAPMDDEGEEAEEATRLAYVQRVTTNLTAKQESHPSNDTQHVLHSHLHYVRAAS